MQDVDVANIKAGEQKYISKEDCIENLELSYVEIWLQNKLSYRIEKIKFWTFENNDQCKSINLAFALKS